MAGERRRAREIALQILVQMDVNPELDATEGMRRYFDHLRAGDDDIAAEEGWQPDAPAVTASSAALPAAPAAAASFDDELVGRLVSGVAAHRAEIDERVQALSRNWRLERMALVERNAIRMAVFELGHAADVPVNVVINEAIELVKRYGTAEGAAFVNGLLDRAAGELRGRS